MKQEAKKKNNTYVYVIKDLDGQELAQGLSIDAVCDYIGCGKSTISEALRDGRSLIKRKYLVNRYLRSDYLKEKAVKIRRKSKFEKEYENVKWHLDIYGNTIVWKDPKKIIKELESDGYEVEVEFRERKVTRYITADNIAVDELPKRWIITLIKKGE